MNLPVSGWSGLKRGTVVLTEGGLDPCSEVARSPCRVRVCTVRACATSPPARTREELSARTELFAEVVAELLELGDDGLLLLGLADDEGAVLRVCRTRVPETGTEVADGLL
jgi:hypothetical protein